MSITPPSQPTLAASRGRNTIPLLISACFFMLCGALLFFHPLWRDEAQAFVLARDSHSLAELYSHLRYEGHPGLWHVLLFAITRITVNPQAMQLLHLLLATGSVYLFARFSPFSLISKLLFPLGYFPLFEYGILSRNYQIAVLLIFIFVVLWRQRPRVFLWHALILALLLSTNIFGIIIAGALGILVLTETLFTRTGRQNLWAHKYAFLAGSLLVIAAAAFSYHFLVPPPDSGYDTSWSFDFKEPHTLHTLTTLWTAYVPIPHMELHFWNTNLLADSTPAAWLSVASFILFAFCMTARPLVLVPFVLGSAGILAFLHVKLFHHLDIRFNGNLFILLIACLWLSATLPGTKITGRFSRVRAVLMQCLVALMLGVHVFAAGVAIYYLTRAPFSPSREAAAYLQAQLKPGETLICDSDSIASSLAAYLPGRQFFFTRGERFGTFKIWDNKQARRRTIDDARDLAKKNGTSVLMIRRWDLNYSPRDVEELRSFTGAIVDDERFYFYRVSPPETRGSED